MKKALAAVPVALAVAFTGACGSSNHHHHDTTVHVVHHNAPHSTVTHHVVVHPKAKASKKPVHKLIKKGLSHITKSRKK